MQPVDWKHMWLAVVSLWVLFPSAKLWAQNETESLSVADKIMVEDFIDECVQRPAASNSQIIDDLKFLHPKVKSDWQVAEPLLKFARAQAQRVGATRLSGAILPLARGLTIEQRHAQHEFLLSRATITRSDFEELNAIELARSLVVWLGNQKFFGNPVEIVDDLEVPSIKPKPAQKLNRTSAKLETKAATPPLPNEMKLTASEADFVLNLFLTKMNNPEMDAETVFEIGLKIPRDFDRIGAIEAVAKALKLVLKSSIATAFRTERSSSALYVLSKLVSIAWPPTIAALQRNSVAKITDRQCEKYLLDALLNVTNDVRYQIARHATREKEETMKSEARPSRREVDPMTGEEMTPHEAPTTEPEWAPVEYGTVIGRVKPGQMFTNTEFQGLKSILLIAHFNKTGSLENLVDETFSRFSGMDSPTKRRFLSGILIKFLFQLKALNENLLVKRIVFAGNEDRVEQLSQAERAKDVEILRLVTDILREKVDAQSIDETQFKLLFHAFINSVAAGTALPRMPPGIKIPVIQGLDDRVKIQNRIPLTPTDDNRFGFFDRILNEHPWFREEILRPLGIDAKTDVTAFHFIPVDPVTYLDRPWQYDIVIFLKDAAPKTVRLMGIPEPFQDIVQAKLNARNEFSRQTGYRVSDVLGKTLVSLTEQASTPAFSIVILDVPGVILREIPERSNLNKGGFRSLTPQEYWQNNGLTAHELAANLTNPGEDFSSYAHHRNAFFRKYFNGIAKNPKLLEGRLDVAITGSGDFVFLDVVSEGKYLFELSQLFIAKRVYFERDPNKFFQLLFESDSREQLVELEMFLRMKTHHFFRYPKEADIPIVQIASTQLSLRDALSRLPARIGKFTNIYHGLSEAEEPTEKLVAESFKEIVEQKENRPLAYLMVEVIEDWLRGRSEIPSAQELIKAIVRMPGTDLVTVDRLSKLVIGSEKITQEPSTSPVREETGGSSSTPANVTSVNIVRQPEQTTSVPKTEGGPVALMVEENTVAPTVPKLATAATTTPITLNPSTPITDGANSIVPPGEHRPTIPVSGASNYRQKALKAGAKHIAKGFANSFGRMSVGQVGAEVIWGIVDQDFRHLDEVVAHTFTADNLAQVGLFSSIYGLEAGALRAIPERLVFTRYMSNHGLAMGGAIALTGLVRTALATHSLEAAAKQLVTPESLFHIGLGTGSFLVARMPMTALKGMLELRRQTQETRRFVGWVGALGKLKRVVQAAETVAAAQAATGAGFATAGVEEVGVFAIVEGINRVGVPWFNKTQAKGQLNAALASFESNFRKATIKKAELVAKLDQVWAAFQGYEQPIILGQFLEKQSKFMNEALLREDAAAMAIAMSQDQAIEEQARMLNSDPYSQGFNYKDIEIVINALALLDSARANIQPRKKYPPVCDAKPRSHLSRKTLAIMSEVKCETYAQVADLQEKMKQECRPLFVRAMGYSEASKLQTSWKYGSHPDGINELPTTVFESKLLLKSYIDKWRSVAYRAYVRAEKVKKGTGNLEVMATLNTQSKALDGLIRNQQKMFDQYVN